MALKTFTLDGNRFSTFLHGTELSITFPYTALTQEEEWLLEQHLAETAAPPPSGSVLGLGAAGFGQARLGG